jgi:hypothetical protein
MIMKESLDRVARFLKTKPELAGYEVRQDKGDPLERIMTFAAEEEHFLVTTTGIHLARRIGEALKHACQGDLDLSYGDGEQSIRVTWRRD